MNTYLLSYNPFDAKVSASQLLTYIRDNRNIAQYWQPWFGTYVIKSYEPINPLIHGFSGIFDGNPFIVSKIEPKQTGGELDPTIWPWINTGALPQIPDAKAPNALLGITGATP